MSEPELTEDEQAAIALSQDADMVRQELKKWRTLEKNVDHGPSEQLAKEFADTWEGMLEDITESVEDLDVDIDSLNTKLTAMQRGMRVGKSQN